MIIMFTLIELLLSREQFRNPYAEVGDTYEGGLGPIAADFTVSPPNLFDIGRLSDAVVDYLQPLYFPGTPPLEQQAQLGAVVSNVYNAYIDASNPIQSFFTPGQLVIVNQLLSGIAAAKYTGPSGLTAVDRYLAAVEENLGSSGLASQEQAPLFLATAIARNAADYFSSVITTPGTDWADLLDADLGVRASLYGEYVSAAVVGALIGITQSVPAAPTDAQSGVGFLPNIFTALAGALAVTFGVLYYKWVTKPLSPGQMELSLNKQVVTVFGGGPAGGTHMANTQTCGCPIQFSRADCPIPAPATARPASQLAQDTCNTHALRLTCVASCRYAGCQSLYVDVRNPNHCSI